jgi:hypothetical protein
MYDIRPNLIIGFHGCDEAIAIDLVKKPDELKLSKESFDWLGHGFYFWENNYERALQWAVDKKGRGKLKNPAVVGAVINLGYCCDFLDSKFTGMIGTYFELMKKSYEQSERKLPENKDITQDQHKDRILRELDCAVIEFMHSQIQEQINTDMDEKGFSVYTHFDSTRGAFHEGGPAFDGAGLSKKSHIQVCIRNSNCIKGFFLPRKEVEFNPKH